MSYRDSPENRAVSSLILVPNLSTRDPNPALDESTLVFLGWLKSSEPGGNVRYLKIYASSNRGINAAEWCSVVDCVEKAS